MARTKKLRAFLRTIGLIALLTLSAYGVGQTIGTVSQLDGRPIVCLIQGETSDMRYLMGLLAGQRIHSIGYGYQSYSVYVRDVDRKAALKLIRADRLGRVALRKYEDPLRKPCPDIDIEPW